MSKLTDTTPGSSPKIMLDNIIYRTINDRKNKKEKEKMKTPNCLPKNNPHKIPNGTGFIKVAILNPSRETPAFAKAKIGIIPKATYGEIACSSLISIEFL